MLTVPQAIKDLLHQDHCQKNIRIHFPNGERSDICNDLIVKDSVSFTESLCSQDKLKFGLCEASTFECETVGVGNVKGATIYVYCEVYCQQTVPGSVFRQDLQAFVYPIPYGVFTVESSQRQADMIHRRIVAYSQVATRDWDFSRQELLKCQVATSSALDATYDFSKMLFSNSLEIEDFIDSRTPATFNHYGEAYADFIFAHHINATPPEGQGSSQWMVHAETYHLVLATSGSQYHTQDYTDELLEISYDLDVDEFNEMCSFFNDFYRKYNDGSGTNVIPIGRCPFHKGALMYTNKVEAQPNDLFNNITAEPVGPAIALNDIGMIHPNKMYVYPYLPGYTNVKNKYVYVIIPERVIVKDSGNVYKIYQPYKNISFNFVTLKTQNSVYLTVPKEQLGASYYLKYSGLKLKDFVDSFFETSGVFGRYTRNNELQICDIKQQFGLRPNTSLYPGLTLYPGGVTGGSIRREDYQTCWYDDEYIKPFGAVTCSYTDTNNVECVYTLYIGGFDEYSPIESYQIYDLSDNAFISANLWTESQIQDICDVIADAIDGVTYMAVDFLGRGLPYVETGDTFEILTRSNDSITTIVLNKTTSGEQTLTDSYKSV